MSLLTLHGGFRTIMAITTKEMTAQRFTLVVAVILLTVMPVRASRLHGQRFLIFIIDVGTRIVKHRKALLSVGFCGILVCRKGAVSSTQAAMLLPALLHRSLERNEHGRALFEVFLPMLIE